MKNLSLDTHAWLVGLFFTTIILFSIGYVSITKSMEVRSFSGSEWVGHENKPDSVKIFASPQMKWSETNKAVKVIGIIFLVLMWPAIYYVSKDKHLGVHKEGDNSIKDRQVIGKWLIFIFPVLSIIVLFAGYSSSLDLGSVEITKADYDLIKDNTEAVRALFIK